MKASFLGRSRRSSQHNCRELGGICLNVPYAIISPLNSEDVRHPSQPQGGREDPEDISIPSYKSCKCCLDTVRQEPLSCFSTLRREWEVLPTLHEYGREAAAQKSYFLFHWQGKPGAFLVRHPGDAIPSSVLCKALKHFRLCPWWTNTGEQQRVNSLQDHTVLQLAVIAVQRQQSAPETRGMCILGQKNATVRLRAFGSVKGLFVSVLMSSFPSLRQGSMLWHFLSCIYTVDTWKTKNSKDF